MSTGPHPDRASAQRLREAAFARIGRVRGATVIGAGALTAAIAGIVSAVAPGRTLGAKPHSTAAVTRPGALVMPPLASPSQLGLQGPNSPPQAAPPAQAQVAPAPAQPAPTSGGS